MEEQKKIENDSEMHENVNQLIEEVYIVLNYIGSKRYVNQGIIPEIKTSIIKAEQLLAQLREYLLKR